MKINKAALILLFLAFSFLSNSQDTSTIVPSVEVNRVYPAFSVSTETLKEAHTLLDINPHYNPSWVRKYISVEISTVNNGRMQKTLGTNDTLSQDQKDNINTADPGTDISINVKYIPENTLKNNEAKEFDFTLKVDPDSEAKFTGGKKQLIQYLREYAIDKIPEGSFTGFDLYAVKFTIDEEGQVIDAHIFWPSNNEKVDDLLLEAICNMPSWMPAKYANGLKVKQEFALTVGNMESCVINLLNIRKNPPEANNE